MLYNLSSGMEVINNEYRLPFFVYWVSQIYFSLKTPRVTFVSVFIFSYNGCGGQLIRLTYQRRKDFYKRWIAVEVTWVRIIRKEGIRRIPVVGCFRFRYFPVSPVVWLRDLSLRVSRAVPLFCGKLSYRRWIFIYQLMPNGNCRFIHLFRSVWLHT
jgi:hypothetical protein